MHRLVQTLGAAALFSASLGLCAAAAGPDCRRAALNHLHDTPDGQAVYAQLGAPDFFDVWLRCDDPQLGLPTAIHESTHRITAETDAFPLVGGGAVPRPQIAGFLQPHAIARRFKTDDFVTIYLKPGKASSSTDFLSLLDELNAYTHDLNAAVDLKDLKVADMAVDHRDGLAAMMAFTAAYAETARAKEPRTWAGLRDPAVAHTIRALWGRAEGVMAASCGIPRFGAFDKMYIGKVCAAGPQSALAQILGRAPACPTACLEPTAEDAAWSGDTVESADEPPPPARRAASARRTRRLSSVQD